MTASAAFKPLSMADSCILSLPSIFNTKPPYLSLSIPSRPSIKLHLAHSFKPSQRTHFTSLIPLVAQTSDWAQQEEENDSSVTLADSETEAQDNDNWVSDGESGDVAVAEGFAGSDEEEGFVGSAEEEDLDSYEPPEDAKIFVGNLPYDIDSQRLAELFEEAGTVEIAEVIYNRETQQSRGFGFVSMSTVEEAEKAVELFHRYDFGGRSLTVNKAAPRGARPDRPPRVFEESYRIYVGNLPWDIDNARLEQLFSEHGKVVDARVVYDRDSGRSRGFGFVTMASETELNDAIAALDGSSLDGRAIRVNVAEQRPRRTF